MVRFIESSKAWIVPSLFSSFLGTVSRPRENKSRKAMCIRESAQGSVFENSLWTKCRLHNRHVDLLSRERRKVFFFQHRRSNTKHFETLETCASWDWYGCQWFWGRIEEKVKVAWRKTLFLSADELFIIQNGSKSRDRSWESEWFDFCFFEFVGLRGKD